MEFQEFKRAYLKGMLDDEDEEGNVSGGEDMVPKEKWRPLPQTQLAPPSHRVQLEVVSSWTAELRSIMFKSQFQLYSSLVFYDNLNYNIYELIIDNS